MAFRYGATPGAEFDIRIDPDRSPATIDVTDAKGTLLGIYVLIYVLNGDQLTLLISRSHGVERSVAWNVSLDGTGDVSRLDLKRVPLEEGSPRFDPIAEDAPDW